MNIQSQRQQQFDVASADLGLPPSVANVVQATCSSVQPSPPPLPAHNAQPIAPPLPPPPSSARTASTTGEVDGGVVSSMGTLNLYSHQRSSSPMALSSAGTSSAAHGHGHQHQSHAILSYTSSNNGFMGNSHQSVPPPPAPPLSLTVASTSAVSGGGSAVGVRSDSMRHRLESSNGAPDAALPPLPTPRRFEYTSSKHSHLLLESLSILRRRKELCDVVLLVGSKKIFAHRVILAAYSPYFLGN